MFCFNCGKEIVAQSKFCKHCGADQENNSGKIHGGSNNKINKKEKAQNPLTTISGLVTFIVVFVLTYYLLSDVVGGVIGAAIAGGIAGGAAWFVASIQVSRVEKDNKDKENS